LIFYNPSLPVLFSFFHFSSRSLNKMLFLKKGCEMMNLKKERIRRKRLVLFFFVVLYLVLFFFGVFCFILFFFVLSCFVLVDFVLCCFVSLCFVLLCSVLLCVPCNALFCFAVAIEMCGCLERVGEGGGGKRRESVCCVCDIRYVHSYCIVGIHRCLDGEKGCGVCCGYGAHSYDGYYDPKYISSNDRFRGEGKGEEGGRAVSLSC
jgi:hypothetical protein